LFCGLPVIPDNQSALVRGETTPEGRLWWTSVT
jgi:hypothetical protein